MLTTRVFQSSGHSPSLYQDASPKLYGSPGKISFNITPRYVSSNGPYCIRKCFYNLHDSVSGFTEANCPRRIRPEEDRTIKPRPKRLEISSETTITTAKSLKSSDLYVGLKTGRDVEEQNCTRKEDMFEGSSKKKENITKNASKKL